MTNILTEEKAAIDFYWKRIQLISFILSIFIVIRHNSSPANYESTALVNVYNSIKYSLTEIAVPMFFLISGFNFYRNYSTASYKRKFYSRIKSLLVPYLTWNTIYCIFSVIISIDFFARFFIGRERFIVTPLNVILSCVFHESCNSHFWFVFDLMVCVILNPVVHLVIKRKSTGILFLSIIIVLVTIVGVQLPVDIFYRTDAFLYYYIGGFLGLHYVNVITNESNRAIRINEKFNIKTPKTSSFYFGVGFVFLASSALLLIDSLHPCFRFIIILFASYGLWRLSACCKYFKLEHLPQGGTVFFIYAAHGIIQPIVVKLLFLAFPKFGWIGYSNFLLSVTITVALCIVLRNFVKRYFKPVDNILTGWRR